MKKFLAVAVVLAFVAGGAFAISIEGEVIGGITVLYGTSGDDDEIRGGGSMSRIRLGASGSNADGTFGAWLRIEGHWVEGGSPDHADTVQGYGWWRPIPMFWMAIGAHGDGYFSLDGNSQWMFYRAASGLVVDNSNAWNHFEWAFYGGFSDWGAMLTLRPIPELALNFGLPFIDMAGAPVGDIFQSLHAQAVFSQAWGQIGLTYVGGEVGNDNDSGSIFAYVGLGMIDNLALDIGLGFHLLYNPIISIGVAAQFDISAEFGLRARAMFQLETEDAPWAENLLLFDVLPFFSIAPNVTIFCSVGILMTMPQVGDAVMNWHLNPYVQIGAEWSPRFFAGFRLYSENDGSNGHINWQVPIGLVVNF